jgi:hypothetical protein
MLATLIFLHILRRNGDKESRNTTCMDTYWRPKKELLVFTIVCVILKEMWEGNE